VRRFRGSKLASPVFRILPEFVGDSGQLRVHSLHVVQRHDRSRTGSFILLGRIAEHDDWHAIDGPGRDMGQPHFRFVEAARRTSRRGKREKAGFPLSRE
jgi:hypothetical protein